MSQELWRKGAAELAGLIRERRVTSRQVVEACLERIRETNPAVNAITQDLSETALEQAAQADQALARGEAPGLLHGVPLTIKENIELTGSAATSGLVMLKDALPPVDAPLAERLKAAGAIPLGRTNMPEFALRVHTTNPLWGATINPRDPALTTGGSSGGDAAAVAAGMVPLGIGNDYGGSIRYPAHCCGVLGIKPSHGRVPDAAALAPAEMPVTVQMFMAHGPLARRVADLELALKVMSGPHPRDPQAVPAPWLDPAEVRPHKVALVTELPDEPLHPWVQAGLQATVQALKAAGYQVEAATPPSVAEAALLWGGLAAFEIRHLMMPYIKPIGAPETIRGLEYMLGHFPELDTAGYMKGLADIRRMARQWRGFFETYPLVLGPACSQPAHPVDYDIAGQDEATALFKSLQMISMANVLGLPALVFPVQAAEAALPIGVQLIASQYREDICLAAAGALEKALGAPQAVDPVS